jgi:uncharacterized protein (TIGR04255 family)
VTNELGIIEKHGGLRSVSRLGVRFINRIDVPNAGNGIFRFEDYIAIGVNLPKRLENLSEYQWMVSLPFPERNAAGVVQSFSAPPELPGTRAFMIDIDVFALNGLPSDIGSIMDRLQDMRVLKNEIFELTITDKAREAFR